MTHTDVSIVYVTYRRDPAFAWFADGLAAQLGTDEAELVVVDGMAGEPRVDQFATMVGGRFSLRYVQAKPTVFNGPHRRTRLDMHAASSARNTGLVCATAPFVAFVDDCSVPMPGWWAEVQEAAYHEYVVAGAYQKHEAMQVEAGRLIASRAPDHGIDARWSMGADDRVVEVEGGQIFGCSLGVPRSLLLEIGGFDELCDGIGGEDYHLGLRMEMAGARLFYSRSMLTIESEEHHRGAGQQFLRVDPVADPDRYMTRLADFGVTGRTTGGAFDASHMVLDILHGRRSPTSVGNHYDISTIGPDDFEGTAGTLPETFWFDGRRWDEL